MKYESLLFPNQEVIGNKVYTKFLGVHDDTFYRTKDLENIKEELVDLIDKDYYKVIDCELYIQVISETEKGINVLLFVMVTDDYEEIFTHEEPLMNSLTMYSYYEFTPCNFSGFDLDKLIKVK